MYKDKLRREVERAPEFEEMNIGVEARGKGIIKIVKKGVRGNMSQHKLIICENISLAMTKYI